MKQVKLLMQAFYLWVLFSIPARSCSMPSRSNSGLSQRLSNRGFGQCDDVSVSLKQNLNDQDWERIMGKQAERLEVKSDGTVKSSGWEKHQVINEQIEKIKNAGSKESNFKTVQMPAMSLVFPLVKAAPPVWAQLNMFTGLIPSL